MRDGVVLNTISAPVAVDADGIAVPARFAIDVDGELSIEVPHRGRDLRYPLMVDPEVRDVWGVLEFTGSCGGGTAAFAPGIWGYAHWVSPFTPLCGEEWAGSGRGLHIKSEASTYLNGAVAQWAWNAPSGSYIMSIWFDGLRHGAQGSHLFTGLFGSEVRGVDREPVSGDRVGPDHAVSRPVRIDRGARSSVCSWFAPTTALAGAGRV